MNSRIRVGITIGDPSGIGPAMAVKALARAKDSADFIIIGDSWVLDRAREKLGQRSKAKGQRVEVADLQNVNRKSFRFGRVKAEYGRASIEYLGAALELIRRREIDCLVTGPISKEAVNAAGYKYAGHTDFFAARLRAKPVMMLLNERLKISLVTRHIPLKEVSARLSAQEFSRVATATHAALKKLFLIRRPRIAACGVNPHASDNGLIGSEENAILAPAIKALKKRAVAVEGPLSADVALHRAYSGEFDAVIAAYHDQALIPLKLSSNRSGINLTLGLPFIRTSPLHGTAFDLAARPDLADPGSMIAALKLAVQCASQLKRD
jgi:4-hydroxythreonine-4-phosphate dehydrogenase